MKKVIVSLMVVVGLMIGGGVVAQSAGTLSATLTWQNTETTDGIQIEKSANIAGTYTIIKQTAANVTTYVDATNAAGDTACYRIAYFNTSGVGPYAGPVCKTFPIVPTQAPATFGVN